MKKLLRKLNKKTNWLILFFFQFIHALGLFAGALILSLFAISIFQILKPYAKIVLLVSWALLILITNYYAFKDWKKGFFISTAFLLLAYLFAIS